jgi:hypothetical protein
MVTLSFTLLVCEVFVEDILGGIRWVDDDSIFGLVVADKIGIVVGRANP